jgi:hypothetical protein
MNIEMCSALLSGNDMKDRRAVEQGGDADRPYGHGLDMQFIW